LYVACCEEEKKEDAETQVSEAAEENEALQAVILPALVTPSIVSVQRIDPQKGESDDL